MSRRKVTADREPSGRPRRTAGSTMLSPILAIRLRDAALVGLRDAIWATSLGQLFALQKITSVQFAAGKRWMELVHAYGEAVQAPRTPRSASLERGRGATVDPDSPRGVREARRHAAAIASYNAGRYAIERMGKLPGRVIVEVCERNEYPAGPVYLDALRTGLSALAVAFAKDKR